MNRIMDWAKRYNIPDMALVELRTLFLPQPLEQGLPGGAEAITQAALRVEAPRLGNALWRNNSGAMLDESGRLVRYGLGHDSKKLNDVWKSSDLIGITPVSWAGRTFGVFTAVECKRSDWRAPENDRDRAQLNFGTNVESLGGIFLFATSAEQYRQRVRP